MSTPEETIENEQEKIRKEIKNTADLFSINMEGYEVIEKQVKSSGNTGRIYLPTDWIGTYVKVVRVTPIERKKRKSKLDKSQ